MRGAVPLTVGPVHFVGIGGIGMSGIAEVMVNLGYTVQGSDIRENPNVARLRDLGATVHIGHHADNVNGAGVVVVSTAVKEGNPELDAARARGIPIVRRAEMLAELMRLKWTVAIAGTHGKTTTTSLIAAQLDAAGFDPTVINGGVIHAYASNAKLGEGDWMVVEADESDGSFLKLGGTVAVVTNMDPEHLDHYGDFDALRRAFDQFVQSIPFYGFAAVCGDHPEVQALAARISERRIITYGFNPQAEVRAVNLESVGDNTRFDVIRRPRGNGGQDRMDHMVLPMAGRHNVLNALASIAVARELGASADAIRSALAKFTGVKRRFTTTGEWNGVRVIDDYGHHPVEIAAALQAAREVSTGKVLAVVQPHRYTRLKSLFEDFCTCFNDADTVLVADVFAAGEEPIAGADQASLVAGLTSHGHRDARPIARQTLVDVVRSEAQPGDIVICLGAGDITAWAHELPDQLNASADVADTVS